MLTDRKLKKKKSTSIIIKDKKQFSLSIQIIPVKSNSMSTASDGCYLVFFLQVHQHKEVWSLSVIDSTFDSVAGICCITVHTKCHGNLVTVCPREVSHEI